MAWNRYLYNYSNPLKYIDPSGHIPIIDDDNFNNRKRKLFLIQSDLVDNENFWFDIMLDTEIGEFRLNNESIKDVSFESRCLDGEVSDWVIKLLEWTEKHPIILRSAPDQFKELLFTKDGTRIIMVHKGFPAEAGKKSWHINTDLRLFQKLNHTDLSPYMVNISQFTNMLSVLTDPFVIIYLPPNPFEIILPEHDQIDT